jgi:hypothetical protein
MVPMKEQPMNDAHPGGAIVDLDGSRSRAGSAGSAPPSPGEPAATAPWARVARLVGAVLGFLFAVPAVALAAVVAAASTPPPGSATVSPDVVQGAADSVAAAFAGLAFVFAPDGFAGGSAIGLAIALLAGPIAAAVMGAFVAPSAARAVTSSGLWMGCLTYLGAIAIAPLAAAPAAVGTSGDLASAVPVIPVLWLVAIAALAPAFVVCLIAGPLWAIALRRTLATLHRSAPPSPASLPIWPVILGGTLVFLGWAAFASLIGSLSGLGGD